MTKKEETLKTIDLLAEKMNIDLNLNTVPSCLAPILSDIAISLAMIADALTEGGQDDSNKD